MVLEEERCLHFSLLSSSEAEDKHPMAAHRGPDRALIASSADEDAGAFLPLRARK